MKDKDIDYSDIPELDDAFFKNAVIKMPEKKSLITIRIDKDILAWFKSKGRGYQTKINALLRGYIESHH